MEHDSNQHDLDKCSGSSLPSDLNWSSSEWDVDLSWYVNFTDGYVVSYNNVKYYNSYYVRYCRDITE